MEEEWHKFIEEEPPKKEKLLCYDETYDFVNTDFWNGYWFEYHPHNYTHWKKIIKPKKDEEDTNNSNDASPVTHKL